MSISAVSYLSFPGNAREAMTFYGDVFGSAPGFLTFGDMDPTAENADAIMHSQIVTDLGIKLMGADSMEGTVAEGPSRYTICLVCHTDHLEYVSEVFAALADGGQVGTPLTQQMWGDYYGDVTDKFGIQWAVNCGDDR